MGTGQEKIRNLGVHISKMFQKKPCVNFFLILTYKQHSSLGLKNIFVVPHDQKEKNDFSFMLNFENHLSLTNWYFLKKSGHVWFSHTFVSREK